MGVIRQLKNFFTGKIIYPKTLTKAVYDENGERLDKILRDTMLATDSEEYNGVEPRDADTLGGKYKSDDITAIKEKVNEINSSLTNNDLGDYISLAGYTSEFYTLPSDGYIICNAGNTLYGTAECFLSGSNTDKKLQIYSRTMVENNPQPVEIYAKKGMKCIVGTISEGSSVSFMPFSTE